MVVVNFILQKRLPFLYGFFHLHKIFYTLGNVVLFGGITLVFSIMIFIIGFLVRKNQKTVVYGISLLILSIIPFFLLTLLWVIPGVLGIIAGLMLLIRKS